MASLVDLGCGDLYKNSKVGALTLDGESEIEFAFGKSEIELAFGESDIELVFGTGWGGLPIAYCLLPIAYCLLPLAYALPI